MVILGIDPGSERIGYGLISKRKNKINLLEAGILKIEKEKPRLLEIKHQIDRLIKKWQPKILAIEKIYFMKNKKTALDVIQSRGVIILEAEENNLIIKEYAPNEIKAGITGYGLADKKAVAKMVKLLLNEPNLKIIDDATDALAAAIITSQVIDKPKF